MTAYSNDLACAWTSATAKDNETLVLFLQEKSCCDMSGAIKFATAILPKVTRIDTRSGGVPDTLYEKVNKTKWVAYERRGFNPKNMAAQY